MKTWMLAGLAAMSVSAPMAAQCNHTVYVSTDYLLPDLQPGQIRETSIFDEYVCELQEWALNVRNTYQAGNPINIALYVTTKSTQVDQSEACIWSLSASVDRNIRLNGVFADAHRNSQTYLGVSSPDRLAQDVNLAIERYMRESYQTVREFSRNGCAFEFEGRPID